MNVSIREFTPDDYPALCNVSNAAYPEYPDTAEEWRHHDENRDPKCRWRRWVAEKAGAVVAHADYSQNSGMYHPRKFGLGVTVHPDSQGQGIGASLYELVLEKLAAFDPILVRSNTREDMSRGMRFLQDRGFEECMREWESRLDIRTFDMGPYEGHIDRVSADGIEIRTIRELEDDPERDHKLWDLDQTLDQDVPSPDPPTPVPFEHWRKARLQNPNLLPDAWFVAVDGHQYVGCSNLWSSLAKADVLYTGLTGVRREYRRRGIALALKLRAIQFARERGCPQVRTWNESRNEGMLSINVRLGFVRQPAWVDFVKQIQPE